MTTASIGSKHYEVQIQNGRQEFLSDEPKEIGGEDSGPAPDELLEASLASCTAITLRMYADRKQWPVTGIIVTVTLARAEGRTVFERLILINGTIDETQKQRMLEIAKSCPVSKTLLGEIEINSRVG